MIWVGSKLWRGVYGAWQQAAYVLFIVYVGVVVSDMVSAFLRACQSCWCTFPLDWSYYRNYLSGRSVQLQLTFCIGLALRHGLLKPLKDKLLPKNSASITKAEEKVTKWSKYIGKFNFCDQRLPS